MLIKILIISVHYKVLDWQKEGHAFQFKNLPKVYKPTLIMSYLFWIFVLHKATAISVWAFNRFFEIGRWTSYFNVPLKYWRPSKSPETSNLRNLHIRSWEPGMLRFWLKIWKKLPSVIFFAKKTAKKYLWISEEFQIGFSES